MAKDAAGREYWWNIITRACQEKRPEESVVATVVNLPLPRPVVAMQEILAANVEKAARVTDAHRLLRKLRTELMQVPAVAVLPSHLDASANPVDAAAAAMTASVQQQVLQRAVDIITLLCNTHNFFTPAEPWHQIESPTMKCSIISPHTSITSVLLGWIDQKPIPLGNLVGTACIPDIDRAFTPSASRYGAARKILEAHLSQAAPQHFEAWPAKLQAAFPPAPGVCVCVCVCVCVVVPYRSSFVFVESPSSLFYADTSRSDTPPLPPLFILCLLSLSPSLSL